eukprot:NODE_110_length_18645_cov_0.794403.p9 type:complete len:319 gc:universal NODE_110_length_18645_cov_0.794403:16238-15282(-)
MNKLPIAITAPHTIVPPELWTELRQIYEPPTNKQDTCRAVYISNLDTKVTDVLLHSIIAVMVPVISVKVIADRSVAGHSNIGIVELPDRNAADSVHILLNGIYLYGKAMKVQYASQGTVSLPKQDTSTHSHVFVGDLSNEVDDEMLREVFNKYPSLSDARIMVDPNTARSRGYGFIAFREKSDAEKAIAEMNGQQLGNRFLRVNWANQKTQQNDQNRNIHLINSYSTSANYEEILKKTPEWHKSIYIGNVSSLVKQAELQKMVLEYGKLQEFRFNSDTGMAFAKLQNHESAAKTIFALNGKMLNGRPIKVDWGKEQQE